MQNNRDVMLPKIIKQCKTSDGQEADLEHLIL